MMKSDFTFLILIYVLRRASFYAKPAVNTFVFPHFIEEGVDITAYELYCHHDGDEAAPEFIPFNIRNSVNNLVNKDVV